MLDAAARTPAATPDQYALTDSTTMGIATMYGGLDLRPGDEVLTTTHDFYSTEDSLRLLERRTRGARSAGSRCTTTPRRHVGRRTWSTGWCGRSPPAPGSWRSPGCTPAPASGCRSPRSARRSPTATGRRDAPDQIVLCVDGVHGFAAVDVDLPDLGCDFLATGTHKWLFGPRGTGILWARDWDPLTEMIPTFSGPDGGPPAHRRAATTTSSTAGRSTQAFAFHDRIGRDRVVARTVEQATRLKEGIAGIDGLPLVTPEAPDVSAGIVCVDVPSMPPADAV